MSRQAPDEHAIRRHVGADSLERARSYHRSGAVSNLVQREGELSADVQGNDVAPYRVTLQLDGCRIVESECSCPVGAGGSCKHVAATLLTLADDPEAVAQRPALRQLLAPFDREALSALLLKRAAADPGFAGWVEAELATTPGARRAAIDPAPVAAQARAVMSGRYRSRNYWDDYHSRGDVSELQALVEKAVPFLEAGDGRNALKVLEAVTEVFVDEWIDYASGSDEHLYELFYDLGQLMAEAALMSDLDEAEREVLIATLDDWNERLAEYGVEEGFALASHALRSGWDDPRLQAILDGKGGTWAGTGPGSDAEADDADEVFGEETDDDPPEGATPVLIAPGDAAWLERQLTPFRLRVLDASGRSDAYLHLARACGAHAEAAVMLARLGRTGEAVTHAEKTFTLPNESLSLAKALKEAGAQDAAFGIAEQGLHLGSALDDRSYRPGGSVVPLAHWLREEAAAAGRDALALDAARAAFERTHARDDFRAVRPLAGAEWESVRGDLLAHLLAAQRAGDRTEILLDEGLIDAAVESVGAARGYHPGDAVVLRLMEAAHASHPDWVIRIAERNAEEIMDGGLAGSYENAAEWLKRAAMAYDAAGRIDDWSVRIEGLIQKHRRKYKLRPLLEALRFGG